MFSFKGWLLLGAAAAALAIAQTQMPSLGAGWAVTAGPSAGMAFYQDVGANCAAGSSCTFPTCGASGATGCMNATQLHDAIVLQAYLVTSAQITSAYLCTVSTGCNSGNATATLSLCPQTSSVSNCKSFSSSQGQGQDLAYLLNAPASSTFATINLSVSQSATWAMQIFEVSPPAGGYTFSALDSEGASFSDTCTTCTLGSPTLSGTDLVFDFFDANGAFTPGKIQVASPYVFDGASNAFCLDCTTTTAPSVTYASGTGATWAWLALKTTAGSYSAPMNTISYANRTISGTNTGLSCSAACPALTIPSTTSGNMIRLWEADSSNRNISSVSGCGGTWVVPTTLRSGAAGGNVQSSVAYNLSPTAGCTSLTVTLTGNSTGAFIEYDELHKTSGSWTFDTGGCTLYSTGSNNPVGEALTLNNTTSNHAVFQSIAVSGGQSGATFYPWTFNGGSPTAYQGSNGGSTNNFASDLGLLNTKSAPTPTWDYPINAPGKAGVCADAYY